MSLQTKLLWIITVATIGWIVFMRPYTPKDIIQFELAETVANASTMISNWGDGRVSLAKTSIYLDFIFIVFYCSSIMLGCKVASRFSGKKTLQTSGNKLTKLIWVGGLCDVIENIAMLKTLQEINQLTVSIAYYFAAIKFGIIAMSLLFILLASVIGLTKSKNQRIQKSESISPH